CWEESSESRGTAVCNGVGELVLCIFANSDSSKVSMERA
ncbi:hypothetical protein A2U01_0091039, partial [Trifolium medium]|nr:hypothetical protein [Trifolium medium]